MTAESINWDNVCHSCMREVEDWETRTYEDGTKHHYRDNCTSLVGGFDEAVLVKVLTYQLLKNY